jgi:multiple sugar transport system permease protein
MATITKSTKPLMAAEKPSDTARRRKQFNVTVIYALLIAGALIYMLPLIVMVNTSFKPFTEINRYPPTFFPNEWRPSNYPEAWTYGVTQFPRWTMNTLLILAGIIPGVLITCSLCAYGFARLRFPGRNIWFMLVLASIMLPQQVTLIPLYILFSKIGWLDTFWPLIVPPWFGGGAVNIFLMRQFFMQIPRDLDEAAIIDGANHFTIWSRIYVPLSRPALVSVALLTVLANWNDFFGPLIYLRSPDNYTLAVGLNFFQLSVSTQLARTDYIMAISTLMVLPMVLMFLFAQKYIVQGFITSGVKG